MSTVGNLIQRVQSIYSRGVESDDSRLTRRHVYSVLLSVRNTLLFNKINKNQFISHWNHQVLPCVEMIVVPSHECPCLPPIGCEMMRTKFKLPKPISNMSRHILISVTSVEGGVTFNETSFAIKKYKSGNKYTANKPDYFIKDEYLYITVRSHIRAITIIGIFNDPVEVANYPNICGNDCTDCDDCPDNPMDVDFNIDEDLEFTLLEMSNKELERMFNRQPDNNNNAIDDTQG